MPDKDVRLEGPCCGKTPASSSPNNPPVNEGASEGHSDESHEESNIAGRRRSRRMRMAGFSGVSFRLLNAVILMLTTPILVSNLGDSKFGIFVTITSFTAYLALSDFGVGAGLLTVLGGASAGGDRRLMAGHVISAFHVLVAGGVVVLVVGLGAAVLIDIPAVLGASPGEAQGAELAYQCFVVGFAIGIPLSIGARIQQSLQQGAEAAAWLSSGTCLSAIAGALAAWYTGSIVATVVTNLVVLGFVGFGQTLRALSQHQWVVGFGFRFKASQAREIVTSSFWLFLLQLLAVIAFQTDLLIVSSTLGSDEAAVFNVALRLFALVSLVTTALAAQFWPASAEALSKSDVAWVRGTHRRLVWQLPVLAGVAGLALIVFGQAIIGFWLGQSLVPPISLLIALALWSVYSNFLTPYSFLLNGAGIIRSQVALGAIMAAANLVASIYLTQKIGLAGPPLGSLLASAVIVLLPTLILTKRVLEKGSNP